MVFQEMQLQRTVDSRDVRKQVVRAVQQRARPESTELLPAPKESPKALGQHHVQDFLGIGLENFCIA